MPRITRRSVASKEKSSPAENPRSSSQRKRGAKKEEPEEDVAAGEPHGTPSKRGGRHAAKEEAKSEGSAKGRAAARGRSTSRGGRGKKEEPESEEEETVDSDHEEEEEKTPKGGARGKGKGKGGRSGNSSTRGARNTSRTGRGSKAAEEEEEEEDIDKEESDEETPAPTKGRGSKGKGRAAAVAPSPQGGRRGRGKAAAVEDSEDKMDDDEGEDVEESKDVENAVETTPKGRQRHTPNKEAASSSAGQRRGRGQKSETTPKTPPSTGRSSRRAGGKSTSTEPDKEEEKSETEPMDTEDAPTSKTEPEKIESSAAEVVAEEKAEPSPSKKRKLEDETDEHAVKRLKTSQSEPEVEEVDDFVIINKDDVPTPDSKEVADSLPPIHAEPLQPAAAEPLPPAVAEPLPPVVADRVSQPTTPDDTDGEGPRINPLMAAPGGLFAVPLTEAELTKQYTTQQRDKDETSSILVEVGSECASDVTGLSSRGLDISDVLSLDSMDQISGDGASDLTKDPSSPTSGPTPVTVQGSVPQQHNVVPVVDQPVLLPNNSSNATSEDSQIAAVESQLLSTPACGANPDVTLSSQCSGTQVAHGGPAHLENANTNPISLSPQAISQNGTAEELTDPHLTSRPDKAASETYVPSSTAIDARKFILNPAFPVEMMDPAFCFSVVSYNILADCHMRRSDYSYTQPQFLEQQYRHTLLLKELDYLDGDIICLQEVNPAYYNQTLLPALKSRGYDGDIVKRTKEYWDEGEATFVKTSKFDIVSNQSLLLGELAFKEVDDSGLSEAVSQAAKKYLDRADVILLTELRCKKTGKVITVCNIHVVYDLKAPDVQCIQVACAIKQLVAKAGSDLNPHIICGDFNSEVTSPGYQLARDGYLSDDHIHKLQALQNLDIDSTDGSSRCLINLMWTAFQHTSSNLKSSYELTLGKEPPITSFTKSTHQTLDYIYLSTGSIDTVGVLETLDLQVVDATGGLPTDSIPSDHLSLKAVFRLK